MTRYCCSFNTDYPQLLLSNIQSSLGVNLLPILPITVAYDFHAISAFFIWRSTFVLSHLLNYRHLSRLPVIPGQVACLLLSLAIISSLSVKMSFPIFSPAVQQVSLYPLGKAGCKSFTGSLFAFTLRLGTLTWAKPDITRETTEPYNSLCRHY